jgi:hypothetical protein
VLPPPALQEHTSSDSLWTFWEPRNAYAEYCLGYYPTREGARTRREKLSHPSNQLIDNYSQTLSVPLESFFTSEAEY